MLYYAEKTAFGKALRSETERIVIHDEMSDTLTYQGIQPFLMREVQRRTEEKGNVHRSDYFPAACALGAQPEGKTDDCEKPDIAVAA